MVRLVSQRTYCNTKMLRVEWSVEDILGDGCLESGVCDFHGIQWRFRLDKLTTTRRGCRCPHAISVTLVKVTSSACKRFAVQSFIEDRNREVRHNTNCILDSQTESKKRIWHLEFSSNLTEMRGELMADCAINGLTFVFFLTPVYENRTSERENKILQTSIDAEDEASSESLAVDFRYLLDDGTHSDITLKCGDHTVPAHRSILSARSKVLSAMLSTDADESRTVELSDMHPPILDRLVQFIYSAKLLDLTVDAASELYAAGDKYAIDSLKAQCSAFLKKNLAEGNACGVAALGDAHSDEDLKEWAVVYILRNEVMRKNDIWFQFCDDHPRLANEILNRVYRKVTCGQQTK